MAPYNTFYPAALRVIRVMTRFLQLPRLTIRQKVILGFGLSLVAFLLVGIVEHQNILRIERKLRFVLIGYELQNTLLEARRYEKNFLLYGGRENYDEAFANVERAKEISERIAPDVSGLKGATYLQELQRELAKYSQLLTELIAQGKGQAATPRPKEEIEAGLREKGKHLVDLSLRLSEFENARIQEILNSLKTKFTSFFVIVILLGLFVTMLVSRKIVKPLNVIERTTSRIAKGDFKPLPVVETADETQAVVEAFNKMISELHKRQDQLVQAQKLSSLGILTSGIAHQLNNPLNNISTSCQILLEELGGGDPSFIKKLLTNIDGEVDRARDIVKGLLEFSREREFQLGWVNLASLAIKTLRLVSSQLPAGIEVTTDIPEELDIYADGQKLQEVLLNLLLNAAQAMPDGSGKIAVTAREDGGRGQVEISVSDTGCGIPEENMSRIFDPFFTTKEVGFGTGLGLSVAHGIVERHGGTLTVKSKVGEGSVFTIRLPFSSGDHIS
jgi:signal transduction histidine kinase